MLALHGEPPLSPTAQFVLDPVVAQLDELDDEVVGLYAPALLDDALTHVRDEGAEALLVEMEPVRPTLDATLTALGFVRTREMLQLRRSLPLPDSAGQATITTRAFRPGQDEAAWLAVNNRAFDWHPEQGGWTLADVVAREAEPWFDPEGFLLYEEDDRLLGFCWTKIHEATDVDPRLGEIYVIAADPDGQHRGLGRQLTVAGLGWLAGQGLDTAMLYVEGDNGPARHLYEDRLGFHTHLAHRWYRRDVS